MVMTRQFDEESVLDAAVAQFWTYGLHATSMADLAKAAGVQRGSLYHAYGGKEQIFCLAFKRYKANLLEESNAALIADNAYEALDRFLKASISRMVCNSPARGCFTSRTAFSAPTLSEEVLSLLQTLINAQEALLVKAMSDPRFKKDLILSPEDTAKLVICFTRGLAVIERIKGDPHYLEGNAQSLLNALIRKDGHKDFSIYP